MDTLKKYLRMFRYELKNSLYCNRFMFAAAFLFILFGCIYFRRITEGYESVSYLDYCMNMLHGFERIDDKDISKDFPVIYMCLGLIISFITGRTMFDDRGYSVLVHGKSRPAWIACKVLSVLVNTGILYILVIILSLCFGDKENTLNAEICSRFFKTDRCALNCEDTALVIAVFLLIPLMSSLAVAQIQIVVSLCLGSMPGYIAAIIIYVLSVFEVNPVFIANGCMVQRSIYFMEGGIAPWSSVLAAAAVIFGALILQIRLISVKDWI